MALNVLVTGSKGQLGSEIFRIVQSEKVSKYSFFFTDILTLDIRDKKSIEKYCKDNKIDIIVNCAAYTAVDKAESESELAYNINYKAVENLANIAKVQNISLIHISTDYVFDGYNFRPYCEDDPTNPQNIYGKSKLAGEESIRAINPLRSIIIRTSWLYSSYGNNFVKTMIKYGKERQELQVVYDQVGTPTYAADLAYTILQIMPQLNNEWVETFHYSNEGVLSWYDFAKEIIRKFDIECTINPIESDQYPTIAKRPFFSVLSKRKIKDYFGVDIPYWRDSLYDCLSLLGEHR